MKLISITYTDCQIMWSCYYMWALISNIDDDLANCCKVIQYSVPHIYADLDFAIVLVLNLIAGTVRSLLTEELTLM